MRRGTQRLALKGPFGLARPWVVPNRPFRANFRTLHGPQGFAGFALGWQKRPFRPKISATTPGLIEKSGAVQLLLLNFT